MSSSLYIILSPPYPSEEGSDGVALMGTWHPTRFNPSQYLAILEKKQTKPNQPQKQPKNPPKTTKKPTPSHPLPPKKRKIKKNRRKEWDRETTEQKLNSCDYLFWCSETSAPWLWLQSDTQRCRLAPALHTCSHTRRGRQQHFPELIRPKCQQAALSRFPDSTRENQVSAQRPSPIPAPKGPASPDPRASTLPSPSWQPPSATAPHGGKWTKNFWAGEEAREGEWPQGSTGKKGRQGRKCPRSELSLLGWAEGALDRTGAAARWHQPSPGGLESWSLGRQGCWAPREPCSFQHPPRPWLDRVHVHQLHSACGPQDPPAPRP